MIGQCLHFDDPNWKYEPLVWKEEEWSEEHDELSICRQSMLMERLYISLCFEARQDHYWRLDMDAGFWPIIGPAVDKETQKRIGSRHEAKMFSHEHWIVWQLQEDATDALHELAEQGRIEWVIRNGWPWIHIPDAASVAAEYALDPSVYNERQARIDELKSMPYREYLQTPEWSERRRDHYRQAGERCQVCNRKSRRAGDLHVHHRTYANRGNERFSDLIVLCADCHQHFHNGRKVAR